MRKLVQGEEPSPSASMAGYTWLTELPFGRPGRRVVKRHSDGRCAIVHHDPDTDTIKSMGCSATPAGHDAFVAVVDRWVSEHLAMALIGPPAWPSS